MRKVIVTAYNPDWEGQFEKAAADIRKVIGKECIAVHHIGSTSVFGLAAKPIIDLMPIVNAIETVDLLNEEMTGLGYTAKGENGLAGRRYFEKGGDNRTHHVHFYEAGNPEVERHLAFRNYLRNHPQEAQEYALLKHRLAAQFPTDAHQYSEGKAAFVAAIEQRALSDALINDRENGY